MLLQSRKSCYWPGEFLMSLIEITTSYQDVFTASYPYCCQLLLLQEKHYVHLWPIPKLIATQGCNIFVSVSELPFPSEVM